LKQDYAHLKLSLKKGNNPTTIQQFYKFQMFFKAYAFILFNLILLKIKKGFIVIIELKIAI